MGPFWFGGLAHSEKMFYVYVLIFCCRFVTSCGNYLVDPGVVGEAVLAADYSVGRLCWQLTLSCFDPMGLYYIQNRLG